MRAFLVDDEELALNRLSRLLGETGRVEVVGRSQDPEDALPRIRAAAPDLLFLDIEMPGMTGFEMLAQLEPQPLVIFTTAYDQYALRAFGVNSVDYLLKPIEAEQLDRTLDKIERVRGGSEPRANLRDLMAQLAALAQRPGTEYPERIASRSGERVEFVELSRVTHFYSSEKLTFAATTAKDFIVDYSIQDLEQKLDPRVFVRVHRSSLLNVKYVRELYPMFAGRMMVRLKDGKEITVARDRVKALKDKLGI